MKLMDKLKQSCVNVKKIADDMVVTKANVIPREEIKAVIADDKWTCDPFRHHMLKEAAQPRIKDSGARTEFETGAVRDIQEGKGRCDLMPLDVMALLMNNAPLSHINKFQKEGTYNNLYMALRTCELFENYETMMLEVAIHFEEGAKKYGENNWQKGIPVSRYIDSAVRHYLKHLRGDRDEPHDRAFCWNIMCAIWTCKHKPELNNYLKLEDISCEIT